MMHSDVAGASIVTCHPQQCVHRRSVLTIAAEERAKTGKSSDKELSPTYLVSHQNPTSHLSRRFPISLTTFTLMHVWS